ncbi:hypothetical protein [Mucilaginibacter paludis]|uniref:TerB family tellurite resistance protein n=1 Tax=Mucilaginibacter paludis DSM 18603 TaxID=714943 RepID=H1YAG8_9SPHI|nr:hypothetical protein [Mucilaginibacter paludis]EHQ27011.1 hypothetical protein Mucpa_2902 [Mucilaginibacter paludis DSM 18603]
MKKIICIILILAGYAAAVKAQSTEIQQLLLNAEKLRQFKSILADMKKGYEILNNGYNGVKDLSQGNFNLHKTFLDGLLLVSPTVRKYKKTALIISSQIALVKEYKTAYSRFRSDGNFAGSELDYMGKVYAGLLKRTAENLDELIMVTTAGQLRMSDDERIKAIDRIYDDMQDKLTFLYQFDNSTRILGVNRARQKNDNTTLRNIYGINN